MTGTMLGRQELCIKGIKASLSMHTLLTNKNTPYPLFFHPTPSSGSFWTFAQASLTQRNSRKLHNFLKTFFPVILVICIHSSKGPTNAKDSMACGTSFWLGEEKSWWNQEDPRVSEGQYVPFETVLSWKKHILNCFSLAWLDAKVARPRQEKQQEQDPGHGEAWSAAKLSQGTAPSGMLCLAASSASFL